MAKLERKALAHYLGTSFDVDTTAATAETWFLIGADLEDFSVELNADIETKKNILGETSVRDKGYEPKASVGTYYANSSDAIYDKLRSIAMQRTKGDVCKTWLLEVFISDTSASTNEAYVEEVLVKPTSYGGSTDGISIPYDIYFCGNRQKGTVAFASGVPTFTKTQSLSLG